MSAVPLGRIWHGTRKAWDRLTAYLPIVLMALLALGTYLLARNTPVFMPGAPEAAATHDPDYFMRGFTARSFDAQGRLKSEVSGAQGRHYPDTDTLEIDRPRIRAFNARGQVTMATARQALSNGDGSEVQLLGDAIVIRDPGMDAAGQPQPRLKVSGEFLHLFVNTEQLRSHRPVAVERGNDRFVADSLEYNHLDLRLEMRGRVRGVIAPGEGR